MNDKHYTEIYLHNPQALRIEFRLDDSRLTLWWSPKAGQSFDARDRNFSSRDDHLDVFESITIPSLRLADFVGCDYDAYSARLRFSTGPVVTIATVPDAPVVLITSTHPLVVNFRTGRYDERLTHDETGWLVRHREPAGVFEFAARGGRFKHQPLAEPWRAFYARAELAAGQTLAIGVGLEGENIAGRLPEVAPAESRVARDLRAGTLTFRQEPVLTSFYEQTRRSLHSAIDESGAIRAALKRVYYLIWLRDGAFCFNYQAAAGWLHKHAEWCRLVLENPLHLNEPGVPKGRAFGQLISQTFGKLEEDGIYYAVWSAFTHWVQTGDDQFIRGDRLVLLEEALAWLEGYIFDSQRGLFGEHFADETPVRQSRDHGWDGAIGQPGGEGGLKYNGRQVRRSYDCYINLLLHGVYSMLLTFPAVRDPERYRVKADRLWQNIAPFLNVTGPPPYGELLMEDGQRIVTPAYEPARSVYVWAFCLPGLAPIPNADAIRLRLLRDVMHAPAMHWLNGIGALVASLDTLACEEGELLDVIRKLVAQGLKPGKYLPMGGAMPEKYDAPEGEYHHDIRPQAFAQSAFLAACVNLGVRRLPFGLAVRPTKVLERLGRYAWRGGEIDFIFPGDPNARRLVVNGVEIPGTLQIPESALQAGHNEVTLTRGPVEPRLVRSNVRLDRVQDGTLTIAGCGNNELVFDAPPAAVRCGGQPVALVPEGPLWFARFGGNGPLTVTFEGCG